MFNVKMYADGPVQLQDNLEEMLVLHKEVCANCHDKANKDYQNADYAYCSDTCQDDHEQDMSMESGCGRDYYFETFVS